MALFGRKSDEEKAEKKAFKQARDLKRKGIASMVSQAERLNYGSALNVASDEVAIDEEAVFVATGELDNEDAKSALVATNRRIIIGWMKGLSVGHSEIRYEDIDQIDVSVKLTGASMTLRHGSHSTKLEKSATKKLERLKEVVRDHQGASLPSRDESKDSSLDLEKIAELHASGILTDDEFTAAKARALGL